MFKDIYSLRHEEKLVHFFTAVTVRAALPKPLWEISN